MSLYSLSDTQISAPGLVWRMAWVQPLPGTEIIIFSEVPTLDKLKHYGLLSCPTLKFSISFFLCIACFRLSDSGGRAKSVETSKEGGRSERRACICSGIPAPGIPSDWSILTVFVNTCKVRDMHLSC